MKRTTAYPGFVRNYSQSIFSFFTGKLKQAKSFIGVVLIIAGTQQSHAANVTVTTALDELNGNTSSIAALIGSPGGAGISLREAIIAANNTAGADIIMFSAALNGVPITLTIANAGGTNEDFCATGDLDVLGSLTITGNGSANTIIQAGTTNANGIDKVFGINPFCNGVVAFTISGVTIRYGRNTQPNGAPDFSFTGGGIDWCGFGASSMSMTNCVIDNNNNINGYGGGLNIDEVASAAGNIVITGTTFSNNNSSLWGGGINIFGDDVQVTVNSSTISNNASTLGAGSQGGGVNIRITRQTASRIPFVTFDNTSISGNTGRGFGGGVCVAGAGKQNVTFQNGSSITNNTVLISGVVCQGGGIEIDADPVYTNTFNGTTITGNHADAGANARGGGVFLNTGVMTMTGGSISTNTSREGAGIALEDGTATLSRVTMTGNAATVSGGGIFTTTTSSGTLTMNFGRIVNNTGPSGSALTRNTGTVSVDNNWWGINTTPVPSLISGAVTVNNWLQLKSSASASPICSGSNSTVTASFLTNSVGTAVSTANLVTVIGQPISFSAILGTLSGAQPAIQASGTATVTYTAGGTSGAGSVNAVVDNVPVGESTPARASITVNSPSAAPTSITGTTTICSPASTTLTAAGGTLGTSANYQWGTGAVVGTSPIGGATNSTLIVSPGSTTTYWVRIENTAAPCTGTTSGVTQIVTVNIPSVAPSSISGTTTICIGGNTTLTAVGGTLGTSANYQWGTGAVVGTSPIGGATNSTLNVSPGSTTTYWVRIENTAAPCTGNTGGVTQVVTVSANNTITLTSAPGTNAQVKPVNTAITPITYGTTTATGATFSGLPPGVNGNWAANVATISGTPTAIGLYSYTVTLTGGCNGGSAGGTINVTPALPVTLASFTGKLNSDKTVTLQWKVEDQRDILQYIVEESSDASFYSQLGAVTAGNSNSQTYSYIVGQVAIGYNYYRLKIIELSGKISYSNIVRVILKAGIAIIVYPNPVTGHITIQQFGTIQNKTAVLTDGQGKTLQQIRLTNLQQDVNLTGYPAGMYILRMEDGTVFKLVKL